MQQYLDCTVVFKRLSMVTILMAPGCDRQNYNLLREVDIAFDEDEREMVDEIAGINSQCRFKGQLRNKPVTWI